MSKVYNLPPKRNKTLVYLFNAQSGKCGYCKVDTTLELNKPTTATIDHIVPVSEGGNSALFNLVAACNDCNSRKGNKPLFHFLSMLEHDKLLKRKEKKRFKVINNPNYEQQKKLDI